MIDLANLALAFALLWRSNASGAKAIFNRETLAILISPGFALFHLVMASLALAQIR